MQNAALTSISLPPPPADQQQSVHSQDVLRASPLQRVLLAEEAAPEKCWIGVSRGRERAAKDPPLIQAFTATNDDITPKIKHHFLYVGFASFTEHTSYTHTCLWSSRPVPDLPAKSIFYFSNEDFLEGRRKGLQTFLDKSVWAFLLLVFQPSHNCNGCLSSSPSPESCT